MKPRKDHRWVFPVVTLVMLSCLSVHSDSPRAMMEVRALVLTRGAFEVRVPAPAAAARRVKLSIAIRPPGGGVARRQTIPATLRPVKWSARLEQFPQVEAAGRDPREAWVGEFPIAPTPPGTYAVEARVVGGTGKTAGPFRAQVTVHPRPAWLNARAGMTGTEEVLHPWTSMTLERRGTAWEIGCWNRTLTFTDNTPLFTQITSGGRPLLAAPARVIATGGDGRPLQPQGRWRIQQQAKHRVVLSRDLTGSGACVRVTLSQEYDGFTWCELSLLGGVLNRLELRLPLRRENAKLLYYWPFRAGYFGDLSNLTRLRYSGEGWTSDFRHYVWLGDMDAGLLWTAESSQFWQRPEEPDTIEALPQGDRTELRLRFLKGDARLRQGRFAFGFQATPVKPWPVEPLHNRVSTFWWASSLLGRYRIPGTLSYTMPPLPDQNGGDAQGFDVTRGTLDLWLSPHFDVTIEKEKSSRPVLSFAGSSTRWEVRWPNHSPGLEMFLTKPGTQVQGYGYLYLVGVARRDEWFRVTFTWDRDSVHMFLNGRETQQPPGFSLDGKSVPRPGGLLLGEPLASLSFAEGFAVDELRVLSEPLTPQQMDASEPEELARLTLLRDTFDGPASSPRHVQEGRAVHGAKRKGWLVVGRDSPDGCEITLDRLRQAGYRAVTLAENWTTGWGGTEPSNPEELRALVRAAHPRDLKVLVYLGFEVSDHLEDVQSYGHELTSDGEVGVHAGKPDSYFPPQDGSRRIYGHATAGPNRERLLAGMERLLKEYEIDGFYLDGTTLPGGCLNPYIEGATWSDERGELHGTMPLLDTRHFAQRMRWLVDHYRPGGVIYGHTSSVLLAPTTCFSDVIYNGEQIAYSRNPDLQNSDWFLANVPLDYYRLLICGHAWGVPLDDCNTSGGLQRVGLALLHNSGADTYQWGEDRWQLRRAWLDRDLWRADFHPYWEVGKRWPERPHSVHASYYEGQDGKRTLIVTNFSTETRLAKLPFAAVTGADSRSALPDPVVLYPIHAPRWRANSSHWEGLCPAGVTLVIASN